MKILVTGGAGYIGSVLVPMLLQEGHSVTVIDNFLFKQTSLLDCCSDEKLEIHRGDVRDEEFLLKEVKKSDAIIPLACLTGAPICNTDPFSAKSINFDAIKLIMDEKSPSQMLIFPNTNSGYGVGKEGVYCDESSPLRPITLYGKLKVELEEYLLNTTECVTFRFATLFGISPRMRLDLLVNDFTYRAVYDRAVVLFEPHFKRNYLHVRDAARVFMHAIDNYDSMKGKSYNVGLSDANLSKQELCNLIQQQVPEFQYTVADIGKDPDQRNYIVSNERIESTGYKPIYSLTTGVSELIKGFKVIRRSQFSNV